MEGPKKEITRHTIATIIKKRFKPSFPYLPIIKRCNFCLIILFVPPAKVHIPIMTLFVQKCN